VSGTPSAFVVDKCLIMVDGICTTSCKTRRVLGTHTASDRLESSDLLIVVSWHRLKIQDDKMGRDGLSAWACIRLDRLKQGYRFVHLLDARGMESSGVLLVKLTKILSVS
jgi:hypothetical protein